jgi:hypothetical protein
VLELSLRRERIRDVFPVPEGAEITNKLLILKKEFIVG